MEGVPEPPPSGFPFWGRAVRPAPATSPTLVAAAAAVAAVAGAAAAITDAAAGLDCTTNYDGVHYRSGEGSREGRTTAAAAGGAALGGAGAASIARKRPLGGGAEDTADAPVAKKSRRESFKLAPVWVAPSLLAYPGGRVLLATRPQENAIDTLSLPKDVAFVCYGCDCEGLVDLSLRVVVKVPDGVAAEVARQGVRGSAGTVAENSPRGDTAAAAAAGDGSDCSGGGSGGGGSAGSGGICPGCVNVPVHEFSAVLRNGKHDQAWVLARLTNHMKSFVGWRLFGVQAVSDPMGSWRHIGLVQ